MSKIRFVGLDVHADTIAVALAEPSGEVRSFGIVANRPESIRKLIHKLGSIEQLRTCCEAGPTGYVLYWQLIALGVRCEVIAPTLVPVKSGDRVKTDRRDALKLARSYRAGDLTPVWVPDAAHEALRDLVRAREAAKRDQLRARHRLGKFLLRSGWQRPEHLKSSPLSKPSGALQKLPLSPSSPNSVRSLVFAPPGNSWPTAAWSRVSIPVVRHDGRAALRRPATLLFDE